MAKIKASDLVPVEFQHLLMDFAEQGDRSAWGIGDIALTLVEELPGVEKQEIYKAVGLFSNRVPATVRDYCYVSKSVPVRIRNEYDMLGRHHFKALIPHVEDGNWAALCDTVLSWADDYGGQVPPVWVVREKLAGNEDPMWLRRLSRARASAAKIADDEEAPFDVRGYSNEYVRNTEAYDGQAGDAEAVSKLTADANSKGVQDG